MLACIILHHILWTIDPLSCVPLCCCHQIRVFFDAKLLLRFGHCTSYFCHTVPQHGECLQGMDQNSGFPLNRIQIIEVRPQLVAPKSAQVINSIDSETFKQHRRPCAWILHEVRWGGCENRAWTA